MFSEYYFSADNLQKDFFLRRKMDSEGFLPLGLIANFPRVRSLTFDQNFIIESLRDSEKIELIDNKVFSLKSLVTSFIRVPTCRLGPPSYESPAVAFARIRIRGSISAGELAGFWRGKVS